MKKKEVEIKLVESAVYLQHVKNAVVGSVVSADGDVHIGDVNNYYNHLEPFTPHPLPLDRPDPHFLRRIRKGKGEGNPTLFGSSENNDLLSELEKYLRITLLGDAGMGKSTELEWICHELKDGGQYTPFYIKLRNYNENEKAILEFFKPDAKHLENTVLILDGLDEIDIASVKRTIELLAEKYPKLKILVSSRITAYDDTLDKFQTYTLAPLGQGKRF